MATLNNSRDKEGIRDPLIFSNNGNLLMIESLSPILILPIPEADSISKALN